MSATITWVIEWMQTTPTTANPPETVITAGWRCIGTQSAGTPSVDYTSTVYSTASFPAPEGTFIPYADLTQDQVLAWCWASGVDKDATEAGLQANIDSQINPTVIQPLLPWATA
jgi:hypothetical protein